MRWNPGQFNNSPITNYRVTVLTPSGSVLSAQDCPGTTCTVPTPGNGPSNSVRISVVATNGIGDSDPHDDGRARLVGHHPARADLACRRLLSTTACSLSWNEVSTPSGGSPVQFYRVVVGGVTVDVSPGACGGGTLRCGCRGLVARQRGRGVLDGEPAQRRVHRAVGVEHERAAVRRAGRPADRALLAAGDRDRVDHDLGRLERGVLRQRPARSREYTAAAYTGSAPTCAADGSISANGAAISATGTGTSTSFGGLSPDGDLHGRRLRVQRPGVHGQPARGRAHAARRHLRAHRRAGAERHATPGTSSSPGVRSAAHR